MPEQEIVQAQVTEWEIGDVEPGDVVVLRTSNPGEDIHNLKVNMRDGTCEYVWICKTESIDMEARALKGRWYKNDSKNFKHKLHPGLYDECEIKEDADILCIYPDTPGDFQLQPLNQEEVIETLKQRRHKREALTKTKKQATPTKVQKVKGGVTKARGASNGKAKKK